LPSEILQTALLIKKCPNGSTGQEYNFVIFGLDSFFSWFTLWRSTGQIMLETEPTSNGGQARLVTFLKKAVPGRRRPQDGGR
jgi:hypothetical protein